MLCLQPICSLHIQQSGGTKGRLREFTSRTRQAVQSHTQKGTRCWVARARVFLSSRKGIHCRIFEQTIHVASDHESGPSRPYLSPGTVHQPQRSPLHDERSKVSVRFLGLRGTGQQGSAFGEQGLCYPHFSERKGGLRARECDDIVADVVVASRHGPKGNNQPTLRTKSHPGRATVVHVARKARPADIGCNT